MKMAIILASLLAIALASPAEAKRYKRHHHHRSYDQGQIVAHPSGCPHRAFCGCAASVRIFGRPIRDLFLARNWFKFPHASPGPGMVAVRKHHVMVILAYNGNGHATVYDGNSGGHRTRIHTRSLAGYSIRNPHGSRYAAM